MVAPHGRKVARKGLTINISCFVSENRPGYWYCMWRLPKEFFFHLHINQIIAVANSVTEKAGTISFRVSEKYCESVFHLYQNYQETAQVSVGWEKQEKKARSLNPGG